jgi:hypothetical protein
MGCLQKRSDEPENSDVRLGLAETLNAVAGFPLATFAEKLDALEALQDVTLNNQTGDALEAFVL